MLSPLSKAKAPGPRKKLRAPKGQNQKEEDAPLAEKAAEDTYDGEEVILDPFVRESIILEFPAFPLRSDLRSEDSGAIGAPQAAEAAIDPRLLPLKELAARLKGKLEN
jgi:uncharacterized protein